MVNRSPPGCRRGALTAMLAGAVLVPAVASRADAQYPAGAVIQPLGQANDPGDRLAGALRTLSVNPADLTSLIEAGHDALLLGDANAAVGFFGRADQISPRNGRVKAGLGAALVQFERPADALRLFGQATMFGVPEAEIASDRGLAYDLSGDPQAAQRDYRVALAARPDDDVTRRRLALSQGIGGDRKAAIATLDPLIRKRDLAAWRAQTFVLAMTGDPQGANAITRVMLPQQQAMLQPFLVRLAALSPADKARAVHFGEMPSGGANYARTASAAPIPPRPAAPVQPSGLAPIPPAPPRIASAPAMTLPAPVLASRSVPLAPPPAAAPSPLPATPVLPAASAPASTAPPPQVAAVNQPARAVTLPAARAAEEPPVRYVRRKRDAKEYFAYGGSPYEAVPLAGMALTPHRERVDMTTAFREPFGRRHVASSAVTTAAMLSTPAPPSAAVSAAAAVPTPAPNPIPAAPGEPASATSATASATATSKAPAPSTSDLAAAPGAIAAPSGLPGGSSGNAGHYDLPHAVADDRPPSRIAAPASPKRPIEIAHTEARPVIATAGSSTARDERRPLVPDRTASASRIGRHEPDQATTRTARSADEPAPGDARKSRADGGAAVAPERTRRHEDEPAAGTSRDARPHARRAASDAKARDEDDAATPDRSKRSRGDVGDRASRRSNRDADADPGETTSRAKATGAAPRVYVQVAGGADRDDLGKAWAGVRKRAPELMKGHKPSTTPLRATNRLLVGPFKDEDEAQTFVNKMAGKGVSGFVFRSAKGQKIDRIDTGE